MDAFTLMILACVSGEPACQTTYVREPSFTTAEDCERGVDDAVTRMTKEFGKRPELKGREVEYETTCLNRSQMERVAGPRPTDV